MGPSSGVAIGFKVGTECRSRVGLQGLGPSMGLVPGPRFGCQVRVQASYWAMYESECASRIRQGSGPARRLLSGAQVQDPLQEWCQRPGIGAERRGVIGAQGSGPSVGLIAWARDSGLSAEHGAGSLQRVRFRLAEPATELRRA